MNDLQNKPEILSQTHQEQIQRLRVHIENAKELLEKLERNPGVETLRDNKNVQGYFSRNPEGYRGFCDLKNQLTKEEQFAFLALLALDQGDVLFSENTRHLEKKESIKKLLETVSSLEKFYKPLGGIIGYHAKVLELVEAQLEKKPIEEHVHYLSPPVFDVRKKRDEVDIYIKAGIDALPFMAEMYAVGGAGDRLQLIDEKTLQPLPAARLEFLSRTLFELLIRDVEAREYVYYKLYGKQVICPIILMTSEEKMNHAHIQKLCEAASWYGRGKENFCFIIQPLTPVISEEGAWALQGPCELLLKPGGHGVIWKLAKDRGAFDWLLKQQKQALLVRQINNPLAGVDSGLLALFGYGISHNMSFGFASCPRRENAQEGMNALKEKQGTYAITNLEYTEFSRLKNHDMQGKEFPANTNILFAKITDIAAAIEKDPIPGMLVNMKLPVQTIINKKQVTLVGARLESTMQNIADVFTAKTVDKLPVFISLNDRSKTISVAKKTCVQDVNGAFSIFETPEGAFYDLLFANHCLLQQHCHVQVPEFGSEQQYMQNGPSVFFNYHPALGPLYSIIGQKVRSGKIAKGSELNLEIAELDLEGLELEGSLHIDCECVTSAMNNGETKREFSEHVGRAKLKNVRVTNQGIDHSAKNCYWKGLIARKESLRIKLEGNSEFVAEDITFTGSYEFVVPHGMRGTAQMAKDGKVHLVLEPLFRPSWRWHYAFGEAAHITLEKNVT